MPILGVIASSFQSGLPVLPSDYESIQTITLGGGGAGDITFSSIPQTYQHLQIRGIIRSDRSGSINEGFNLQLNGVTSNSYFYHRMYGDSINIQNADGNSLEGGIPLGSIPGGTAPSNVFGSFVFDILDYSNTNKLKTTRLLMGNEKNTNNEGFIWVSSGLFSANNNAVTSIKFFGSSSQNFSQYSSLGLYGIKG